MTSITPFLWFDNNVPEAVAFYKSVFPNAKVETVSDFMAVFELEPLAFVGLVLVDRLIADQPRGARFARGWLVAMGCFVPGLSWMTALTPPGTLIVCVAYSAMLGAGIAAAPPGRGRWLALPGTWAIAELPGVNRGPSAGCRWPTSPSGRSPGRWPRCSASGGRSSCSCARCSWAKPARGAGPRPRLPALGLFALPVLVVLVANVAPRGHDVGSAEIALVQGGGEQGTRQSETGIEEVFQRHRPAPTSSTRRWTSSCGPKT